MPLQNNLRVQVDKPAWEWCRFAPNLSGATSTTCVADNNKFRSDNQRYIYYQISSGVVWKYDTWTDTYLFLNFPNVTLTGSTSMEYSDTHGFKNRVISATSTTITSGIPGKMVVGSEIRITSGTGRGQRRVITSVADPVIADFGTLTSTSIGAVTDANKNWAVNQWVGYVARFPTGLMQHGGAMRKVLNNNATNIFTQDATQFAYDDECNPPNLTTSSTASIQTGYVIESTAMTVDTAWDVTPDATSRFTICNGGFFTYTGASGTPFFTVYYYDVTSDNCYIRHSMSSIHAVSSSEVKLLRLGENACLWERGKATSGSATTLVDTTKSWRTNQWIGYNVRIFSGTGRNAIRAITGNTATTLTIASGTALDSTSYYVIEGFDSGIATSGSTTTLVDSTKSWTTNRWKDYVVSVVAGTGVGLNGWIASNTGTTLTLNKALSTALDSTSIYIIRGDSDRMYLSSALSGSTSAAMMYIYDLESDMQLSSKPLDFGVARGGSAQYADHPPRAISTGTVAANVVTITMAQNHNFVTGMSITHRGDTGASAGFNNITATITVTGATTYTYPAPSSVNNWTVTAQSTTTLVDASKSWTTNQWAGHILTYNTTQGSQSTCNSWLITSNTANTLTLVSATTAPVAGVSKYTIHPVSTTIGAADSGTANGTHSSTTLQDTGKSWAVNQWAGKRIRLLSGPGVYSETTISSNTSNTLTLSTVITVPVTSQTAYALYNMKERQTGHHMEWNYGETSPNAAGRYIYSSRGSSGGSNPNQWDRYDITTNIWTNFSVSPQTETITSGSQYAYDGKNRIYYMKDTTQRLYYLDLITNQIHGAGFVPYVNGSAPVSNRMEIFTTADGLDYLWTNRGGNVECFIQLLFY